MNVYDVREDGLSTEEADYATCEMCGKEEIRYVHVMEHAKHVSLNVGCVCAGKMEDDYEGARRRETRLRNRAARKAKWLNRKWRTSAKGNHYINAEGHNLVVFPNRYRSGRWSFKIDSQFSTISYDTPEEAKLALFDAFWAVLDSNTDAEDDD